MKYLIAVIALAGTAPVLAQSSAIGSVEAAPTPTRAEATTLNQLSATSAEQRNRGFGPMDQASTPASGRTSVTQLGRGAAAGRDPRVPGPSPMARDACIEAMLKRRGPPAGIDCTRVIEANARPKATELSSEDPLVASARGAGNEVSIRRLEDADPAEIARRLATGYLVNAPAAQNVGADQQNAQQPASGILVITDPSRPSNAPPPTVSSPK